tara:strand:+ start:378 stop:620 length:243 start_codon:yes stop_codon:yes gene_type:complete
VQRWDDRLAVEQAPLKVVASTLEGERDPAVGSRAHDGKAAAAPPRSVASTDARHVSQSRKTELAALSGDGGGSGVDGEEP